MRQFPDEGGEIALQRVLELVQVLVSELAREVVADAGDRAKVKIDSENLVINNYYGKYSYIIERSKFLEVGGYNEQFQGWGFQDLNLFNKIKKKDNKIKYTQNNAFHLYHTKASKQHYQNNKKLFFEEI